jgi:O-antigen ligase
LTRLTLGAFLIFLFSIAWEDVLVLPGLGTVTRLLGLTVLPLCAVGVLIRGRYHHHPFLWSATLFVAWTALTVLWTVSDEPLIRVFTHLQLLIMAWLTLQMLDTPQKVEAAFIAFILGCYVSALATVHAYSQGLEAFYHRYAALGFNPGDLAGILSLGLAMAWYLAICRSGWMAWLSLIYIPLGVLGIGLTAARAGLVAAVIACLLPPLLLLHPATRRRAAWLSLVGVAVIAVGLAFVPAESWERLATTWQEATRGTLNDRLQVWRAGFVVFGEAPLFGVGVGGFENAMQRIVGWSLPPHNGILAVATEGGLIGLLVFAAMVIHAVAGLRWMPPALRRAWYVLLMVLAVSFLTLNWEWRKQTWLILAMVAAHGACYRPKARRPVAAPLPGRSQPGLVQFPAVEVEGRTR